MITAHTRKTGDYYKAQVVVTLPNYRQAYTSIDMFTSRAIAMKHAQAWRNESKEVGYITAS